MWRDAKAGLKRAFPRLIPVVRQCREVAERAHRSVEEAAFYGSGGWVGMKRLRPGMRVRVHPTAWRRSYSAFSPRGYCAEELDVFLSYCSPGMRFVDAGAHYGVFSLAALTFPHSRALLVEPAPGAVRMLERLRRMNGLPEDRFQVVQKAVGGEEGQVGMSGWADFLLGSLPHEGPTAGGTMSKPLTTISGTVTMPLTTIDALASVWGLPTHMKIDVEGMELDALKGARHVLSEAKPIVHLEIHNPYLLENGVDPGEVNRLMERAGYFCKWKLDEHRADEGEIPFVTRTVWAHTAHFRNP